MSRESFLGAPRKLEFFILRNYIKNNNNVHVVLNILTQILNMSHFSTKLVLDFVWIILVVQFEEELKKIYSHFLFN